MNSKEQRKGRTNVEYKLEGKGSWKKGRGIEWGSVKKRDLKKKY